MNIFVLQRDTERLISRVMEVTLLFAKLVKYENFESKMLKILSLILA